MKAIVHVRLKREVLDPQGDAVKRALDALGFEGVRSVRVGKRIEIDFGQAGADVPRDALRDRLRHMADAMLANTVIEDYDIELQ